MPGRDRAKRDHRPFFRFIWAALAVMAWTYACGGDEVAPDPPNPAQVTVIPATAELTALEATVQFTAEVQDQNGQLMTGVTVSWASGSAAVATVDISGLATAAGNGTATIVATAGSVSGSATVTVGQQVSTVEVTPEADSLVEGDTLRLGAEAKDANGHVVEGAEFAWSSSDTAVAVVDGTGLVTGTGAGQAEVSATSSGVTGGAMVKVVAPLPTTIAVTPEMLVFEALDDTLRIAVDVRDQIGRPMPEGTATWESSNTMAAVVDPTGLVTAAGNGTATVIATAGSVADSATVTVSQQVSTVEVTPSVDTLVAGDTLRLAAEARDANGHVVEGAESSWSSSDTAVAVVDETGLVTGTGAGQVEVSATSSGVTGGAMVDVVAPVPTTVAVTPETLVFDALGDTLRIAVDVRDQIGRPMPDGTATWQSSDTAAAVVDSTGLVTAAGNGTATVIATAGSVADSATVTVSQQVSTVEVTPSVDTLVAGDTLRLAAEARDANGHVVGSAEFSWSSGDTAVAVVDGLGLVTGTGVGQSEVSATSSGVTGGARVDVVAPVPTTVAVTPEAVVFEVLGDTLRIAVDVRDQIGRPMPDGTATWQSSDTATAVVDSTGLVTAAGNGTATVIATAGSVTDSATIMVSQQVSTVEVAPAVDTVAEGDTLRLAAQARDANGHVVDAAEFSWSSSDTAVAPVDDTGVVGGAGTGTATITATSGGASGTARVTVMHPDRIALEAFYHATDGPNWADNDNWLTDAPLGNWDGVRTDASGRVVNLDRVAQGLKGPIPAEIGRLARLRALWLPGNRLSGELPPEIANLAILEHINLNGSDLTGPIPAELGNMANLMTLDLTENNLTGPIPTELGNMTRLMTLDLSGNNLTGPIPTELGNLTSLTLLHLGGNHLTGPIPAELGSLVNLSVLVLAGNGLEGPIPAELDIRCPM